MQFAWLQLVMHHERLCDLSKYFFSKETDTKIRIATLLFSLAVHLPHSPTKQTETDRAALLPRESQQLVSCVTQSLRCDLVMCGFRFWWVRP